MTNLSWGGYSGLLEVYLDSNGAAKRIVLWRRVYAWEAWQEWLPFLRHRSAVVWQKS